MYKLLLSVKGGHANDKIKYLKQIIEFDDQWVTAYYNLGGCYAELYQYDKARLKKRWNSLKKAIV